MAMLKTFAIRLATLTIALGGLWLALTQQPPAQPLTVETIASDLHIIVGSGGNIGVLTTPEGVILVDAKFERNVPEILAKVKGITDKPLRYILNTHHHGDHTGGNQKLLEAQTLQIVSHKNARANMVTGKLPGLAHVTFNNESAVYLGGKEAIIRYFGRGHTNGDAIVYFPAHRVVHMGDLFNTGGPFIDYAGGGSGIDWAKTIDGVLKLDFDTVIPGHGPISKKADLLKWRNAFEVFTGRVKDMKFQGKSKDDIGKLLKIDDLGWAGGANFARSIPGLYDELK